MQKNPHLELRHSLKNLDRYVDWIIDESVIFGAIHAVQRLESSASKKSKKISLKIKIQNFQNILPNTYLDCGKTRPGLPSDTFFF